MIRTDTETRRIMLCGIVIIMVYVFILAPLAVVQTNGDYALMEATGTKGQPGYVRLSDIDRFDGKIDNVPMLRDAIKLSRSLEAPVRIPLYEKDGMTVIGSFPLI